MNNSIKKSADDIIIKTPKTTKEFIRNYLLLGLYLEKWYIWDAVPSENALAIKFDCSRLTARNAIQEFVERGIISPFKGKGYVVTGDIDNYIKIPRNKKIPNTSVEDTLLDKSELKQVTQELADRFWIKPKKYVIKKTKYLNEETINAITYTWINQEKIMKNSNPRYNVEEVELIKYKEFTEDFKDLSISKFPVGKYSVEYNENGWVSFSIILKRKELQISYSSKHYLNY